MERMLIAAIHELTQAQREAIRAAAEPRGFEVRFYESNGAALQAAREAEVIFANAPELAQVAPKARWLCTPSAGVNQFTAPGTFASPDCVLSNSSGAYGVTIAEHVVMVCLELMRRQMDYNAVVARRDWLRTLPVRSIRGSRALLLGTGDIGQEVAKRLRAFGTERIVGVNRSGRDPGGLFDAVLPIGRLDEVLPTSDLVVLSLPGTREARHTLDAWRLSMLPEGTILVNVGRGNSIDEAALIGQLRAGRMKAALDVFDHEPLPADSPLWDCPNLLITPHVAGNMTLPYTVERIVAMFLEDFERYCAGEPLKRAVDLEKGY